MNCYIRFNRIIKNNKGVTLVELIVTISIMAIIVTPFVATSVSSSQNNAYAEDRMKSYNLANTVSEEIKSKPSFLESESEYFKTAVPDEYREYSSFSTGNTVVKYRIDKISSGTLPNRNEGEENVFSSFTDNNYSNQEKDIKMSIQNEKLVIKGSEYILAPEYYYLTIDGQNGNYNYNIKNSINNTIINEDFNSDNQTINIGIDFLDELEGVFELHLNIQGSIDKDVNMFITGENTSSRLKTVNEGNKTFYKYTNLVLNSVNKYSNNLYKVEVFVEIDGNEIDRMVSYVKK